MTQTIEVSANPFHTALQVAAGFVIPYEETDKPVTYRLARMEVTPDGSLNTYCLDGKNLFGVAQPGVASHVAPQDFYLSRADLKAVTRETQLESLIEFARTEPGYNLAAVAKQLRTIPPHLTTGIVVQRNMLTETAGYIEGVLAKKSDLVHTWVEIHLIEDFVELRGKGLTASGEVESITARRIFPEHVSSVEDSWVAAFAAPVLVQLARAMDGPEVILRFESEVENRPVLFRGQNRFVLAMPISKASLSR